MVWHIFQFEKIFIPIPQGRYNGLLYNQKLVYYHIAHIFRSIQQTSFLNFLYYTLFYLFAYKLNFPMVNIQDNPLYYATVGGIIVGISTSLNYVLRGSVTGMSGMLYSTVTLDSKQTPKNLTIIGGMLLMSGIFFDIFGYDTVNQFTPFGPSNSITIGTSQLGFALAGVFVGFGTKLSNGCTSGHGLCGIARFSVRSIVAVMTFLLSGLVISTIILQAGGLGPFTQIRYSPNLNYDHLITANICIVIGAILPLLGLYFRVQQTNSSITQVKGEKSTLSTTIGYSPNQFIILDQIVLLATGILFGMGLLVSGMVRRTNVISFLALGKDWNPSLMFVLGAGLTVNLFFFTYMIKIKKHPILGEKLFNPSNSIIDWKLVGGAVCFGIGWGIGGLCPGPAIMHCSIFTVDVHLIWFPFFFLGQFMANKLNQIYPTQSPIPVKLPQSLESTQKKEQTMKDNLKQKSTISMQNNEILNDEGTAEKCQAQDDEGSYIKLRAGELSPNIQLLNRLQVKLGKGLKQNNQEQQNLDNISKILHQHGHGHTHAYKLPSLPRQIASKSSLQSPQKSAKSTRKVENSQQPSVQFRQKSFGQKIQNPMIQSPFQSQTNQETYQITVEHIH